MVEANNTHWADDAELLERYLRGEMDHEERARCEQHASSCPACSDRLDKERLVVTGIRSFGRKQMKSDLQSMLAARAAGRMAAWRWVGAAASVILAVAVWYMPGGEDPVPTTAEIPVSPQMDAVPELEKEAEEEISESAARIEAERRDVAAAPQAGDEEVSVLTDAASGAVMPDTREGAGAGELRAMKSAPAPSKQVPSWSLAVEVVARPLFGRVDKNEQAIMMEAQRAEAREGVEEDVRFRQRTNVVLSQRVYERADLQVQTLSARIGRAIPVQVEDSDDSLRLILYPQHLWDEADLRTAIVSDMGPDSLRILIGGKEFHLSKAGSLQLQE